MSKDISIGVYLMTLNGQKATLSAMDFTMLISRTSSASPRNLLNGTMILSKVTEISMLKIKLTMVIANLYYSSRVREKEEKGLCFLVDSIRKLLVSTFQYLRNG